MNYSRGLIIKIHKKYHARAKERSLVMTTFLAHDAVGFKWLVLLRDIDISVCVWGKGM